MTDLSPGRVYLGRVVQMRTSGPYRYAQVAPLVGSNEVGTSWEGPIAHPEVEFPTRGLVFWHNAPATLEKDGLWQFEITEHPAAQRSEDKRELFQVANPQQPIEVIDLRTAGDKALIREMFATTGFVIEPPPITDRALLWTDDQSFVGPVRLTSAPDRRRWLLAVPDSSQLDVRRIPKSSINRVVIAGERLFVAPDLVLGTPAGLQNWSSNVEVARGVLRRLRKLDKPVTEALKVTDRVFAEYIDAIARSGLLEKDLALDAARAMRLDDVRRTIEQDAQLLHSVQEVLLQSDVVQAGLTERSQEAYVELLADNQKKVDEQLLGARGQLTALETVVSERETKVLTLEARIADLEKDLADRVAKFDGALSDRLLKVASRPEEAFAELAVIKAALSTQAPGHAGSRGKFEPSLEPLGGTASPLTDRRSTLIELGKLFSARGLPMLAAIDLDAGFMSGGLPVIFGDGSYDAIAAYASIVSAGRLLWIPIGASVLEPQDLLGRVDPTGRRLVPHPAGLLDLILEAIAKPDNMFVVVLDGFNRAPAESYLLPFLRSAQGVREGDHRRSIPISAVGTLDRDDPYHSVSRVEWPANVLLAAIPVAGTSALPVSNDIWSSAVLIDLTGNEDMISPAAKTSASTESSPSSFVPFRTWSEWARECLDADDTQSEQVIDQIAAKVQMPRVARLGVKRMFAVLRRQLSPEIAIRRTVAAAIVPRSVATVDALDDALKAAKLDDIHNWRALLNAAAELS